MASRPNLFSSNPRLNNFNAIPWPHLVQLNSSSSWNEAPCQPVCQSVCGCCCCCCCFPLSRQAAVPRQYSVSISSPISSCNGASMMVLLHPGEVSTDWSPSSRRQPIEQPQLSGNTQESERERIYHNTQQPILSNNSTPEAPKALWVRGALLTLLLLLRLPPPVAAAAAAVSRESLTAVAADK